MAYRTRIYYTDAQKAEMWDRWQRGETLHSIARHTFIKTFTGTFDQYVRIYRLYQYSMLDQLTVNGKITVDYIGRYEQLQESFDYVCEQLGISKQVLPHLNLNANKKYSHYTDYYTDDTRRLVELVYRRDITQFGYKFGE